MFHKAQWCPACECRHYEFTEDEKENILNAYVFGDAQTITPKGIIYRCINDLRDYDNVAVHRAGTKARERFNAAEIAAALAI